MLSVVMAALVAQGAVGQVPAGPPGASPLQRQSGGSEVTPRTSPVARQSDDGQAPAPQPGPAAGQAASGVTAYPAEFFASAQANTAREMVDRVPGFLFDGGDSVRGFAGAAGNVLVDGLRPSSKSDDLDSILRRIPAAQVARIDLIRGGAPGIDMQGKAVIANVVRKTGASSTGLVSLQNVWVARDGRQAPAIRLEGTRRDNGRALEASLIVAGFTDDGAGDGTRRLSDGAGRLLGTAHDNSEADGTQLVATASYERPLLGGKLKLNAQVLGQIYTYDERVDPEAGAGIGLQTERDRENKESTELGLHYNRDFGTALSAETVLLQSFAGEDYLALFKTPDEADRFRNQNTQGETILRQTFTWRARPGLTVEAGGEGAYNWLASHTRFAVNGAPIALPAANVDVNELRGEGFLKATWQATPKLSIEAGLRFEASHIAADGDVTIAKTLSYPKPRLFVTWSPTADDQFRLRIEREVGQLDFNDFVASSSLSTGQILAGNPDLNPQQAWVYEGSYERRFLGDGSAVITLRHSELTDVVDRVPIFADSGPFDAPGNLGSGTKDELVATLNLPLKRFGVKGGLFRADVTWRDSKVLDPATGRERFISGLRPLVGELHYSQDLPQHHFKYGADVFLGFRERYFRLSQVETDSFAPIVTLFAEYKPRKDISLRTEISEFNNHYDRELRNYDGVRGQVPIASIEKRQLSYGPQVYVRVRKTF